MSWTLPRRNPTRQTTLVVSAVLLAAATGAVTVTVPDAATAATSAADCGYLFDDFSYSSSDDPALTGHGWVPRSYSGGPGVPGATWSPANITFPTVDGQKVLQLSSSTDGTAGGTGHAEIYTSRKRYFEGTYATRVRFSDAPASGTDGDHVVQTYFTISPLAYDNDPTYSELDVSEYLPNGGWGETGPINYQTTWYTYSNNPWSKDNVYASQPGSMAGWHDLMVQVSGGHVRYFVDGRQVADHSGKYYPRQTMTINFNQWFIDLAGHAGGRSGYVEQVDWTLHARNQVLSPAETTARTTAYRSAGTAFVDTVDSSGSCPDPSPTTSPSSSTSPTPTPTGTDCTSAPPWSFGTAYQTGSVVVHERSADGNPNGPRSGDGTHLWRAKWWSQGSEPGWTANWEDLGRC